LRDRDRQLNRVMTTNSNQHTNDVLVEVQHVTYTHWNQTEPSLHDVSLKIRHGTLNVLVGPSGSGKSTLCDLYNGVIPHLHGGKMEGDVLVEGVNTREVQVKHLAQKVGRVFQDPEIMFATLYVEDEIAFGPENLCYEVKTIQDTVERLLEQTDLVPYRHNLVWNLSGGQIQKLGLATVLAMQPRLIVLDEPTSNLDPGATQSVHDLVLQLRREGVTILLVTRELDEFLAHADQLLVMEAGRLLAAGPPRQVLREHGRYLVASLGVWLPETSEIGIELNNAGLLSGEDIPITVPETIDLLTRSGLLQPEMSLDASTPLANPAPDQEILISAEGLQYAYPGGIEALKGVSIDIRSQEWLMIVGRNGAGKSTLAKMLVGLLKPESGSLRLFGRDIRRWKVPELANHIALVFQNPEHQFLTDSVADEIDYSLLAQGVVEPAERQRRTAEMLSLLGLEAVGEIHPFALSAGLKRRLGVATMLVGSPRLLLVDEPTYGQDKEMTHTLMSLMQSIRARGVAVVMITHDMRLVQEYAERVVVMSDGRIIYDGQSSGLFERTDVLNQANLRRTVLHNLLIAMRNSGLSLQGEVRRTSDLADLFIKRQGVK
jgi:energy-coupling factor transporter ATP-binding protein EcfA2